MISLQRSEMFIAGADNKKIFAPLGAKPERGLAAKKSNHAALAISISHLRRHDIPREALFGSFL